MGRKHESGEEADGKHGRSYRLHWPHEGESSLVEVSVLQFIGAQGWVLTGGSHSVVYPEPLQFNLTSKLPAPAHSGR